MILRVASPSTAYLVFPHKFLEPLRIKAAARTAPAPRSSTRKDANERRSFVDPSAPRCYNLIDNLRFARKD